MSLTCEYCKKIFKTTTNLNRHQRTTKSCIKIQKETINCLNLPNIIIHVCEFCDKIFTSKQTLTSHLIVCKYKKYIEQVLSKMENTHKVFLKEKEQIILNKDKIIKELNKQNLILDTKVECLEKHHEKIKSQNENSIISELQDKIQEIAITALDQKNEVITNLIKKYVKKQPRKQFECSNVIYILTTPSLEKDRRYILGKATNLTNRLSTYNKSDEHKVIFFIDCNNQENMNALEPFIFRKLNEFREQANRERFILPEDKNIDFFIDTIKRCFEFLK